MKWYKLLWLKLKGFREKESFVLTDENRKIIKIYAGIQTKLPEGTFMVYEGVDLTKFIVEGAR